MAPRWQWFDHMSNLDASPIQPKLRRKREPLRAMKIAAQLLSLIHI